MHRIIYICNLVVSVPGSEERWSQAGGGRTEADIVWSSHQTSLSCLEPGGGDGSR